MALPLISCITPTTASRNQYLPLLLRSFLLQDFVRKELVVVSEDFIPLPSHPQIRFVKIGRAKNIGLKRNIACEAARGEFIAHFDSDDYSAPGRLSHQYQAMQQFSVKVTGYHAISFYGYYYDNQVKKEAAYKQKPGADTWACGTSLMYEKAFWQRHLFPSQQTGEDSAFVTAAKQCRAIHTVDGTDMMVAFNHPACTDTILRSFQSAYHIALPVEEVRERIFPAKPPKLPLSAIIPEPPLTVEPACDIILRLYYLENGTLASKDLARHGTGLLSILQHAKEEITSLVCRGATFVGVRCPRLALSGCSEASGTYLDASIVPALAYLVWFGESVTKPRFPEVLHI